jgi:hypothetical protein
MYRKKNYSSQSDKNYNNNNNLPTCKKSFMYFRSWEAEIMRDRTMISLILADSFFKLRD